jgi:predicted dehydrogenase
MTDEIKPLRIAVIGAGEMSMWAILPALHFAPVHLQAICDLDEDRAKEAATKFGTDRWYTDYREMWEKEDIEAVIIQMNPQPRQQMVLEALAAGYHVWMPKPPAESLAAAEELAAAAKESGKVLMVNFQRRFSFAVTRAMEIMQRDSFGPLTQLSLSFCSGLFTGARGRDYEDPIHAFLLDMAPHHLDLASHLGGKIQKTSLFHKRSGDGIALAVSVEFASGAVGTMQLNSQRIWWRNYDRIEITGTGEYLVLDDLWSIKHYTEDQNTFTENWSDERSGELTGDGPCLIEFVNAIREQREPVSGIHDSVETMKLYQAIYGAVREDRSGVIFEQ